MRSTLKNIARFHRHSLTFSYQHARILNQFYTEHKTFKCDNTSGRAVQARSRFRGSSRRIRKSPSCFKYDVFFWWRADVSFWIQLTHIIRFADIALFCLLTRIHELNYDSKYVGGGRRVRLGHLHSAFKQRPSYAVAIEKYSFVFGPRAVAFAGAKAILQKLTVIVGVLLMVAFVGKRLINQK